MSTPVCRSPRPAICCSAVPVKFFRNYNEELLQLTSERVGLGISPTTAANDVGVLFALDYASEKNNNVLSMNRTSRETCGSTATFTMNQAYTYPDFP